MCLKQVGSFLVAHTVSKWEVWYSVVSGAISPKLLVTKNEFLIHVDDSESYENKQQREIQSNPECLS